VFPVMYGLDFYILFRKNSQNHENDHVRSIGQGEARHRKYKRLKLNGGQAYDRSSD
jgi:hypothetical protein